MHFLPRSLHILCVLSSISQGLAEQCSDIPSNLTFGGIIFPNTPTVTATNNFVKQYLDVQTYNHVVRSVAYALLLHSKLEKDPVQNGSVAKADLEIITVAGLLHDMAWSPGNKLTRHFISKDNRFEVDGANAARAFLANLTSMTSDGTNSAWDEHRVQLVWDSIALHGTLSIAFHKEPEVALLVSGISLDILGTPTAPVADFVAEHSPTQAEYDSVREDAPATGLVDYVTQGMIGLCHVKPQTTWDNFVGDFCEKYVRGYTRRGHRFIDSFEKQSRSKCASKRVDMT